mgnify:CR=1 FL=1
MQEYLSDIYIAASQEPAEQVYDYCSIKAPIKSVILRNIEDEPLVWVVPNLISPEECDRLFQTLGGCAFGKDLPQSLSLANSNKEEDPQSSSSDLSQILLPRLQADLESKEHLQHENEPATSSGCPNFSPLQSVSSKWRILKLEDDQEFPAHQDGMESYHTANVKDFCVSTHSVLLPLQKSHDTTAAIRLYYRINSPVEKCPYGNSIDILVPNGYGIVLEQHKDLFYAAQALTASNNNKEHKGSIRYLAQASLMRTLPKEETMEFLRGGAATTFTLGPGLLDLMEEEAEITYGSASPIGWGRHFNPKATLWRKGRPIIKTDPSILSQQRLSLGLINEQKWSIVNRNTVNEEIRRKSQRRKSHKSQVDPVRKRVSYVDKESDTLLHHQRSDHSRRGSTASVHKKKDPIAMDDHSVTSHTEISTSREDEDPVTITMSSKRRDYKPYEVTRKPHEQSLVGTLVKFFQRK